MNRVDEISKFKDEQARRATVRSFNQAGFSVIKISGFFYIYTEFDVHSDGVEIRGTVDVTDLVTEKFIHFRADTTDSNTIVTTIADIPHRYDLMFSRGTDYIIFLSNG